MGVYSGILYPLYLIRYKVVCDCIICISYYILAYSTQRDISLKKNGSQCYWIDIDVSTVNRRLHGWFKLAPLIKIEKPIICDTYIY